MLEIVTGYVLWVCISLIAFVYVGYPMLMALLSVLIWKPVKKDTFFPSVSIVIAAYNEEASIESTIQNKLDLDYPKDKLEIIVVSDGSTDKTESIVSKFSSKGVTLLKQKERAGKTAALNLAVEKSKGEIIVFSDANSIYDDAALKAIVRNFFDPSVGYVTGKMVYVDEHGSLIGTGCSAYMRYENVIRRLETNVGSVIGVDGGIDAIRASLYEPMEPDMLPDFVLPLMVISKHNRVVYESNALLKEDTLTHQKDEWKMRVRVILRSFHAMKTMRKLFNPFHYPLVSLQLFAHKVLRYWVGFFQILAFVANAMLWGVSDFYNALLVAQSLFYVLAFSGVYWRESLQRIGLVKYVVYFCLLNGASLVAFFKFLKGDKQVLWSPRKG